MVACQLTLPVRQSGKNSIARRREPLQQSQSRLSPSLFPFVFLVSLPGRVSIRLYLHQALSLSLRSPLFHPLCSSPQISVTFLSLVLSFSLCMCSLSVCISVWCSDVFVNLLFGEVTECGSYGMILYISGHNLHLVLDGL